MSRSTGRGRSNPPGASFVVSQEAVEFQVMAKLQRGVRQRVRRIVNTVLQTGFKTHRGSIFVLRNERLVREPVDSRPTVTPVQPTSTAVIGFTSSATKTRFIARSTFHRKRRRSSTS